jgi:hypothetical protein
MPWAKVISQRGRNGDRQESGANQNAVLLSSKAFDIMTRWDRDLELHCSTVKRRQMWILCAAEDQYEPSATVPLLSNKAHQKMRCTATNAALRLGMLPKLDGTKKRTGCFVSRG